MVLNSYLLLNTQQDRPDTATRGIPLILGLMPPTPQKTTGGGCLPWEFDGLPRGFAAVDREYVHSEIDVIFICSSNKPKISKGACPRQSLFKKN